MGRTIGVDLGTTNTAVAVFQKGRPKVIEDDKGYKVLPSVVSMREDGSFVVGQLAKSLVLTAPDRTVYAAKRLIGRRFDSPEVQEARKHLPYTVEEGPDGLCRMKVGDKLMTPVEISAIVLQVAKQIAERAIGETVDEVVITVPAYFNHGQRAATMEAARLAGLRCERLLNEPTAAALAFGHRKDLDRNILIYDLGGGTFDVSVLHVSDGIYEVLATDGDTYLGGEDFDQRVVAWLAERFLRQKRVDLRKDRIALQRLKEAAEIAKCELSFQDKARILVPRITAKDNLEDTITRTQLEEQVNDLVERTLNVVRGAVSAAGLQLKDIDDIVLVGGQTRMPRVREAVSGLFGKEPNRNVHPEEVVATGAAIHAESLGNPEAKPALLIDVTPFDLGIDSVGGLFARIIERNSNIPATRTRTFTTARDNQDRVRITVRQGGSNKAVENEFLGEFNLTGLRAAPRMEPKLDVTFRLDSNGMLQVSAVDRGSGERQQISVRNYAEHASEPKMPTPQEVEAELARRAAEGSAAGASAPALGVGSAATGLARLKGLFQRKPKAAAAPSAGPTLPTGAGAAGPAEIEPTELGVEALDEVDPEELGAEALGELDSDSELTSAPLPLIQLSTPPRANLSTLDAAGDLNETFGEDLDELDADELDEEDQDDDTDQGSVGPAVLGSVSRSSSDLRSRASFEDRGVPSVRAAPSRSSSKSADVDETALAAAFLDELGEAGSFDAVDLGDLGDLSDLGDLGGGGDGGGFGGDDLFTGVDLGDLAETPAPTPTPSRAPLSVSQEDDLLSDADLSALFDAAGDPFADEPSPQRGGDAHDLSDLGDLGDLGDPDSLLNDLFGAVPTTRPAQGAAGPELDDLAQDALNALGDPFGESRDDPSSVSRVPFDRPALLEEDLFLGEGPASRSAEAAPVAPKTPQEKRPAVLKIAYASAFAFGREYRKNLAEGSTFVSSAKPLSEGRPCVFEITLPGFDLLTLHGEVAWSSKGRTLTAGEQVGMRIGYRLTPQERLALETLLNRIGV